LPLIILRLDTNISCAKVKRVYISSFWEKPYANPANQELFDAEREDLFRELRQLPRYSSIRKINDLVKRARHVKV
jgi:hypothetical protein